MTGSPGGLEGPAGASGWRDRYERLAARRAEHPLDPADLEVLAVAASLVGDEALGDRAWEDAHHSWVERQELDRAGRCAFWLGFGLLLRGEAARASGWFARGRRVIAPMGAGCPAHGYLHIPEAMAALEGGDVERCEVLYVEMADVAERFDDSDLLAIALLGQGEAAIAGGRTPEGLTRLDEAMVMATTGSLSPLTTGILYCAVIDACVQVFDLRRAAEWTEALTRWCDEHDEVVPYRGVCLVHRSQVLQAHGEWADALAEATSAGGRLAHPPHPALGGACYQRGELHRLRGELHEAEAAYREASQHGRDAAPGLALLRLAQGRTSAAVATVQRMLDERRHPLHRLAVLPAYVEVMLAARDPDAAEAASDELASIGRTLDNPLVSAMADHAHAGVALAQGRAADALDSARRACTCWGELGMPYERARSQELGGLACRALGDADAGDLELEAAAATFEGLGAALDARRLSGVLRRAGASPVGPPLTARECDVLRLVAAGRTNRDIGAALSISEHTVARHLQNIFAKLGVGSRAAATSRAHALGLV